MNKMVKSSVLAFAAALTTSACAQVAINGKIGLWGERTSTAGVTTNALVTEPTSNIAFSAGERIGALTVRATLETSLRGNTLGGANTQLGDRAATVGVATAAGTVDLGRSVHGHFVTVSSGDVFATGPGSIAGDMHNLRGLRHDAGYYASTKLGGVALGVDGVVGTSTVGVNASTGIAGMRVGASYWRNGVDSSTALSLGTTLRGVTLSWLHTIDDTATRSVGDTIGARWALGAATLKMSVGRADGVRGAALGADYALSKRTELGVALRTLDRTVGADVRTAAVGITHRF